MDINKMIEIAEDLQLNDKAQELKFLKERLENPDKDLVLPLVGEFSSGKTTLINSLLDNPILETASKATTASIFEIHFGAEQCSAVIESTNNETIIVDDISSTIKNEKIDSDNVVKVYDTSKRIASSTILVDTPGLSSNTPAHKIALSSYLPNADAILLVTDINQQLTESLLDFISDAKYVKKTIYLIISKCDTKSENEIKEAKNYITKSIKFQFSDIITISSKKKRLEEFDALISKIQENKNAIVEKAINNRALEISKEITKVIDTFLKTENPTNDIKDTIKDEKWHLERNEKFIYNFIEDVSEVAKSLINKTEDEFSSQMRSKLNQLVQIRDCDNQVRSTIDSFNKLCLERFQKDLLFEITKTGELSNEQEDYIPLSVLRNIQYTQNTYTPLTYNLNLSSLGHTNDKIIGGVGLVAAVAIGSAIILSTGGAGAAGVAGAAKAGAGAATNAVVVANTTKTIVADAATDAATGAYIAWKNKKAMQKIQSVALYTSKHLKEGQEIDNEIGKQMGSDRGITENIASLITENAKGKKERRIAINNFINSSLIPEFNSRLYNTSQEMITDISNLILDENKKCIEKMQNEIEQLTLLRSTKEEEFKKQIQTYIEYKSILNEL